MSEQEAQLHAGHRSRLRSKYINGGLNALTDVEVLELLLTYGIPRKDTNALAHKLINSFGGFAGVLEAPVSTLLQAPGITEAAAVLLHLLPDVWQRYSHAKQQQPRFFTTTEQCGDYMMEFMRMAREEQVWMMSMDAKCRMLDCREISRGSVNFASVPIRRVVEVALNVNASVVVLAHNHTSGIALPSAEDLKTTKQIAAALNGVDIFLADHLIMAGDDYVSLRDSNLM